MFKPLAPTERFACLLLLTIWVGGMWLSILVIFPSLKYTLLASILIFDVINVLAERIVLASIVCSVLLLFFYIKATHYKQLKLNSLAGVLALSICLELLFIGADTFYTLNVSMMIYSYTAIAAMGLFALLQFVPWLYEQQKQYAQLISSIKIDH